MSTPAPQESSREARRARVTYDALTATDVATLAQVHRAGFPGFFLSSLGTPFLRQLYAGYASDPTALTVVARAGGRPIGAVLGTSEPAGFYAALLRRRLPGFAIAGLRGAVRNPRAVPRLVRALRYRGDAPTDRPGALLSSIVVRPEWAGVGIGGELMRRWLDLAAARGVTRAYLTTDRDDNAGVHAFYAGHGWGVDGQFATPEGRAMTRYAIDLPPAHGAPPADPSAPADTTEP